MTEHEPMPVHEPVPGFSLDPALVKNFVAGRLDEQGQARLAAPWPERFHVSATQRPEIVVGLRRTAGGP